MIGITTLPLWFYAAWSDVDRRTAENWLWPAILLLGVPVVLRQDIAIPHLLYSILFGLAFALLLYSQGHIGGADAKAFIVIGVVFPQTSLLIYGLTAVGMAAYTLYSDGKSIPVLLPTLVAILLTLGFRVFAVNVL